MRRQLLINDLIHPSFVTSTSDGKTYTADVNGNTLTGAGRNFVWTPDNRVASVTNASGTTTMKYDYTGARVKKLGPLGQVLYPFAGYEVGPTGTKTKFFRLGNELLASKQSPTAGAAKKFFYHNDHLGGVNVITDDDPAHNATRQQLTEYDPWGKVSRSEGNVDPEHRFTGQKLDPENGLYYYGARYYDPELARFISPDPIVPSAGDPQSHNRYSYVRNNPVKYIDPTGHSFLSSLFGGIFKAFSFVMKYAIPAFRIAGGVLELMGGGGSLLSSLQSIAGGMSSYIKNSQFQFASQVFGFFGGGAAQGVSQDSDLLLAGGGGEATSVSEQFGVTPVEGAGSISGEFFIPGKTAGGILQGDSRDFDLAPNLTQSRIRFGIDYENGEGFFEVSPTCFTGGSPCYSALPNGQGSNWNITSVGSVVHIAGSVKNSAIGGAAIDFDMLFTANSSRISYDISRNSFPAFELTRTLNGITNFLVKDYGVSQRFGGFACLTGYLCGQSYHQGTVPLGGN